MIEKLYEIYRQRPGNFLLSPYSIHMALAMAKEGARGKTLEEMEEVLGEDPILVTDTDTLSIANAIWLRSKVEEAWKDIIKSKYNGESWDITNESIPERIINNWVSKHTKGKIDSILREGQLSSDNKLVITNAIHFKDDWKHQFKESSTKKDKFYISDNRTANVDMMNLPPNEDAKLLYAETEDLQVLRLCYEDGYTSMTILLPKSRNGKVPSTAISNIDGLPFTRRQVDVFLPKIKMQFTYSLNEDFYNMGMPTAFTDYADFSGMSRVPLKIGNIIHKTFVDINEEGTEATAVTGVVMVLVSAIYTPSKPVIFRADHPYVFLIKDRRTKTTLFIGAVNNP